MGKRCAFGVEYCLLDNGAAVCVRCHKEIREEILYCEECDMYVCVDCWEPGEPGCCLKCFLGEGTEYEVHFDEHRVFGHFPRKPRGAYHMLYDWGRDFFSTHAGWQKCTSNCLTYFNPKGKRYVRQTHLHCV